MMGFLSYILIPLEESANSKIPLVYVISIAVSQKDSCLKGAGAIPGTTFFVSAIDGGEATQNNRGDRSRSRVAVMYVTLL